MYATGERPGPQMPAWMMEGPRNRIDPWVGKDAAATASFYAKTISDSAEHGVFRAAGDDPAGKAARRG